MAIKPKKEKLLSNSIDLQEKKVVDQLYDEYSVAQRNNGYDDAEFESIIDLLECKRNEKDYEWMSDICIPEYPSIHQTEASQWAAPFQSRDQVECYLSGNNPGDSLKAGLVKELINSTLNIKEVYHYQKYMRLRSINSIRGACYALCRWEREEVVDETQVPVLQQVENPETGTIETVQGAEVRRTPRIMVDRFNYDPIDPRNVFMDNKYVYSLQEKDYIIIRDEVSYEELVQEAPTKGYKNLDKVKKLIAPSKTDTKKRTTEDNESKADPDKPVIKRFDRLLRFGKFWSVITSKEDNGYPLTSEIGLDSNGSPLPEAVLVESIIEEIYSGGEKVLIRYQPNPYRSSSGKPFRPIIRGLCYIHPTKDIGMSDGKYSRELQVALNDIINMSTDRTKLATMPTLKGQENSVLDNDQLYFAPEHIMPLKNVDDLVEFEIKDDVRGAMMQANLFIQKMQQVNAVYPPNMGSVPELSSTTATASSIATNSGNTRANYKSLTFEYTFNAEFYWMMVQMAYWFMHPATAENIWGGEAMYFDPFSDYKWSPVTSSIEMEYSKDRKVTRYDQILGRIAPLAQINPGVIPIIARIIGRQCVLLGDEYQEIKPLLENLVNTPTQTEQPMSGETSPNASQMPTSNQANVPMSIPEQGMREITGG